MASTANKENFPSTPTQSSQYGHEYSPSHPKQALKPISPNKNSTSNIGKLSFLQNDNIDSHFSQIHSVQEAILNRLFNLEIQTKQTGVDLDQLCDRLKNNNQHLNKLLQNISNHSEEVITEGNATKNDINNILSRLDSFDAKLKSIDKSMDKSLDETMDSTSLDLFTTIADLKQDVRNLEQKIPNRDNFEELIKSIPSPDFSSIQEQLTSNQDTVKSINEKLEDTASEIASLRVHFQPQEVTKAIHSVYEKLSKVIESRDKISEVIESQDEKLTKVIESQDELTKVITSQDELTKMITSHDKLSNAIVSQDDKLSKVIKSQELSNVESQNLSKLIESLESSKYNDKLLEMMEIISKKQSLMLDEVDILKSKAGHENSDVISKIAELQNKLPDLDLAHKIIEPIVAELKSVSLDLRSLQLLEDILAAMEISESVSLNEKFRAHFNEKLDTATKTLLDNKDIQIQGILDKLNRQDTLLQDLTSKANLTQTKQDLESKIDGLQAKYDAMTQAYERRFQEFQNLQQDYKELSSKTSHLNSGGNDKINKLNKVLQLHTSKMQDIRERKEDKIHNKRIVSSPIGIRTREEVLEKFEPIYENHSDDMTNNSDVEEF
jgi:DNA repair exonuclease SbcCD ATPase subunit